MSPTSLMTLMSTMLVISVVSANPIDRCLRRYEDQDGKRTKRARTPNTQQRQWLGHSHTTVPSNRICVIEKQGLCILVLLIGERLMLAPKVAAYKLRHNQTILDTGRERQVLDNVVAKARNESLEPAWARQFFVDQMEANKAVQQHFAQLVANGKLNLNVWPEVDLVRDIRPEIDLLNTLLIKVATKTCRTRTNPRCKQSIEQLAQDNNNNMLNRRMAQILQQIALAHVCL